jgi:predicted amidophosphoribosyltransferase
LKDQRIIEHYKGFQIVANFYQNEYQARIRHPQYGSYEVRKCLSVEDALVKAKILADENYHGIDLRGNWVKGTAFDFHTLSSEYLGQDEYGHDRYRNTRSEMGELVYQLKYQHDSSVINKIVDLLQTIKYFNKMDVVIPIPPSNKNRANQPVYAIATEFGKRFNIAVYLDILEKSKGSQELKGIANPDERQKALKNSMHIAKNYDLSGKSILLIDDLYRSGSTLKVATELLYSEASAKNVYALTMTKTRSNR